MRLLTETTEPALFIAAYGPDWRQGLITEHVEAFIRAGGEVRRANTHAGWAVIEGRAYPILCSELVRIDTEDGPVSGRCGGFALKDDWGCSHHTLSH